MQKNTPFAVVSEDSRREGRQSIHALVERLRKELQELNGEKKQLEMKLREVEDWKKTETSRILSSRFPKSESIERTTRLESQVTERKKPFLVQLYAIEERIHSIKSRLSEKDKDRFAEVEARENRQIKILESIESLLKKILVAVERPASNA